MSSGGTILLTCGARIRLRFVAQKRMHLSTRHAGGCEQRSESGPSATLVKWGVEWGIDRSTTTYLRSLRTLLPLLPSDVGLRLDRVEMNDVLVTFSLSPLALTASCPGCGQQTGCVHSRYTRTARDLPIQGRPVQLLMTVRRFFCRNPDCLRRVFCEPIPQLLAKHAHSTTRLADTHRTIGLTLGAESGARLAGKLGMPVSSTTLLRRGKNGGPNTTPAPRIVGVDDWAIRKGQRYGTIIVDLERREVLELLPGRDGSELRTWLGQHPEVEVLCRDRWAPYAETATAAAPQAQQIADRWHLLGNIREALERFLDRHVGKIKAAFTPTIVNPPDSNSDPETPAEVLPPATDKQQQRHDRWREARRRRDEGQSLRRIAREMQLSWRIVQRYLQSDQLPNWRPGRVGPSQMTNYRERIEAWLADGNDNAAALHRPLLCEDIRLSYTTVRAYVSRQLAKRGLTRQRINAARPPRSRAPSTKALSFAVITDPPRRTPTQQSQVNCLHKLSPKIARGGRPCRNIRSPNPQVIFFDVAGMASESVGQPMFGAAKICRRARTRPKSGSGSVRRTLEQRTGRRAHQPLEDDQASNVRPGRLGTP